MTFCRSSMTILRVVLAVLVAHAAALAQSTSGMIAGRVTDASGAVLPGVTVTVINTRTSDTRVTVTNEQGLFRAPNLNPSRYEIHVELPGFRRVIQQGLELSVSETLNLTFRLEIETVEETITVTGESPLVNTTNAEVGTKIEARKVLDLPVNSRDFSRLALFSPAAKAGTSGVADLSFNGTNNAQNNFLLDGTDATHVDNAFLSNGRERGARLQTASSESVEEFRVLASNYSAEYGRAAGAVVTAITKSGSNKIQGSSYFFLRDDSLDARNFFDPPKAPDFSLKQYGASLGGPIRRDHIFFFSNYEGSRKRLGASQTGTVPSESFRARVDPRLRPILETIPLPTEPTANPDVGIARVSGVTDIRETIFSLRGDWHPTSKDNIFGRFNIQDSLVDGPLFVLTGSRFANQRQYAPIITGSSTVSYTRTLRSNLMNEAKFGFNRVHLVLNQTIPGAFPDRESLRTPIAKAFPSVSITGVDVQPGQLQDIDRTNTGFEIIDAVTWFSGTHTVKTGINVRHKQTLAFSGGYPTISFASLADFAANRIQNMTAEENGGPGTVVGWEYAAYVQDNIKATNRLTLNLGLRYDYGTPIDAGKDTTLANFDLKTLSLLTNPPFYAPDRNDFQPRIGVTYDVTGSGRTILGAGYGTYYQMFPLQTFFGDTLFSNVQASVTLNQTTTPGLSFPLPPLTGGVSPPPNRTATDPNRRDNYNHQFNVNVQQQLGEAMSLQVSYVGNRTRNNPRSKPGNLIDPALGRRPYPEFSQFTIRTQTGKGEYDALQVQLNRRLVQGLAFNLSYSWSAFLNDIESPQTPCANFLDFDSCPSWDLEWGRASEDAPHNLSVNSIWELPLGEGRLRKGWQINAIFLARSGLPYTVLLGTSRAGQGWFTNQRPDRVPGVESTGHPDGPVGWLNRDAFADVPAGRYGNLGRNTERGPRFVQLDTSLLKNTPLGRGRLQLRVEVFNVLNKPIWAATPQRTYLSPASFGRVINTFGRTESFGTARQIQLAARFDF
ncbi:MAG TPA: TonB-dependent receptor [Vicinamibacterales bacterium]|nr:TonB-dependent receptor [Vicinamibacterales bacterium]